MLEAFSTPGRFWRGNLHGHSTNSDGRLTPEEVCARYRAQGYDFVSLTDHFRPNYNFPISDTRAHRANGFTTILGAEVHAPALASGIEWHLLAVGLPADFPATGSEETGVTLAQRCRDAGAFVAIAHPEWYHLTLDDALTIESAHAVEVYNHTCAVNADRASGTALLDTLLNAGRRLNAIAVDDSHWRVDDGFGGWVMVKAEENDPDQLLDALKAGAFYASQGPEIHGVVRDGDEIEVRCSPARSVLLLGPGRVTERVHGHTLTRARLPLEKFAGHWCRAVVVDAAGKRAWTNPLWLDG
ncbi:CehA/McbA family metallohydrolase [Bauldia sp.]|uniref:CehA/McbA family metallohydrolase n=1 Tax=Bauldia sp. TaxID=2575872 RepID=UPI003BADA390